MNLTDFKSIRNVIDFLESKENIENEQVFSFQELYDRFGKGWDKSNFSRWLSRKIPDENKIKTSGRYWIFCSSKLFDRVKEVIK